MPDGTLIIVRRIGRGAAWACGVLISAVTVYFGVAILSALFPSPGRTQSLAAGDPPVYVCGSLAHADIVMPLEDDFVDWSKHFPVAANLELPANTYLAFGWGDLRFFREIPTWSDVKLSVAVAALAGLHPTALRVVAVMPPKNDPECRRIAVDRQGRQALAEHILSTLHPEALTGKSAIEANSRFEAYALAKGTYSPFRTCNQWVADGLAAAGLPHAKFAPFSFSVLWPLEVQRADRR
ncbi:MAG: DUF2459 domain-containing protein [Aestuariivirga sp.]